MLTQEHKQFEDIVCKHLQVTSEDIRTSSRRKENVTARFIIWDYLRKHSTFSLKAIGLMYNRHDHSTVYYALDTYTNLIESDKRFRQVVDRIYKEAIEIL